METDKCDHCDRPAMVIGTHINMDNDERTEVHLCAEHAVQAGLPDPANHPASPFLVNGIPCNTPEEATALGVVSNLRGTANFIRAHGRMPDSVEELQVGMALRDPFPTVEIEDGELRKALDFMDELIQSFDKDTSADS